MKIKTGESKVEESDISSKSNETKKYIISFESTDSNEIFNIYSSSRWELESLSTIMIYLACNFTIYNLLVPLKF